MDFTQKANNPKYSIIQTENDDFLSLSPREKSRYFHSHPPPFLPVPIKRPWKTIFAAFGFLILGQIFLLLSMNEWLREGFGEGKMWEYFILGLILFIPGSYHSYIIVRIMLGSEGYSYDMLKYLEEDD